MDRSKDKVGYEINFTKYFYKLTPLRTLEEILVDLETKEREFDASTRMYQVIDTQAYQDTDLELTPSIPNVWNVTRSKYVFENKSVKNYSD